MFWQQWAKKEGDELAFALDTDPVLVGGDADDAEVAELADRAIALRDEGALPDGLDNPIRCGTFADVAERRPGGTLAALGKASVMWENFL